MIKIFTLSNGEQIIGIEQEAGWSRDSQSSYDIHNPFYLIEAQDEYGNSGMKLINVCTFSESQYITVPKQHIIFTMDASDAMSRYYEKIVEANKKVDAIKMIEESIREMEEMEHQMQNNIYKRLVGGSTIN